MKFQLLTVAVAALAVAYSRRVKTAVAVLRGRPVLYRVGLHGINRIADIAHLSMVDCVLDPTRSPLITDRHA